MTASKPRTVVTDRTLAELPLRPWLPRASSRKPASLPSSATILLAVRYAPPSLITGIGLEGLERVPGKHFFGLENIPMTTIAPRYRPI